MTDLAVPAAQRLRRPSWRDARVLLGLLLVLTSTGLGAFAFARADDRVPMYAASADLLPGTELTAENTSRVDVQLGDLPAGYLPADADLPTGRFALRAVRRGELIPASAVGLRADVDVQAVSLQVDATSASGLGPASVVDVYVNRPTTTQGGAASAGRVAYAGPERALEGVHVVSVPTERGVLGASANTRPIQVLVPTDRVPTIVADVDLGAKITVVPAPGTVRKAGS